MGKIKDLIENKPIILPKDNTTSVTAAKKYAQALAKLYKDMEAFSRSYDSEFMEDVDISDYRMFHDAKRLIDIMKGRGKEIIDNAKDGRPRPKLDKITRNQENK